MGSHKYDLPKDKTNPFIYFPIAAASVVIVGWVFGSGFYYGVHHAADHAFEEVVVSEKPVVNVKALAEPTDQLIADGKSYYATLCSSCHGDTGYGDGPNGLNLNPAPRNFHEMSAWKNGSSVAGMWDTLQNGIAGGSMASYQLTPPEQRIAIIHFIRETWVPEPPAITEEDIEVLPGPGAGGAVDMSAIETDAPDLAMVATELEASIVQVSHPIENATLPNYLMQLDGKDLYDSSCATCHGAAGQGVKSDRILTTYPYRRLDTRPLIGSSAPWVESLDAFTKVVTRSTSGSNVHGFATFTKDQVEDLHEFVSALAQSGDES